MPNVNNMSLTAAIEVLFSLNFAVIFDFKYLRFNRQCPDEKAKRGELLSQKSAEELRMGIPALRQYIDVMMHLAPIGNGVQICSIYNFLILFRGFFFLLAAHRLLTQDDSVHQYALRVTKEKKKCAPSCRVLLIHEDIAY